MPKKFKKRKSDKHFLEKCILIASVVSTTVLTTTSLFELANLIKDLLNV
ncbi:hypothetical protein FACS189499_10500 [Clostridia bacterium]|nr:hypothetical protein FACS189499_10500 [Clostridia bacterium]